MKRKSTLGLFAVGFALFATFFGAGNLIFPPAIGLHSGAAWVPALFGMALSAILLPILTIIAVNNMGSDLSDLAKPVSPWFFTAYLILFCFFCGTMGIPRQGGIAVETGIFSVFPALAQSKASLYICMLLYFILVYLIASNRGKVVDIVGKYLTPILLVILLAVVVLAFIKPLGVPGEPDIANSFMNAFLEGYQTGDVMVGIVIAGIFIASIRESGNTTRAEVNRETLKAALIAFVMLLVVYGGFLYAGATVSAIYDHGMDQTALLNSLVYSLLGSVGSRIFGVGVFLACLTTTVGVITSMASMVSKMLKDRVPYKVLLLIFAVVGFAIGCLGVAAIVRFSLPSFYLIYPIAIVLTLLGTFRKYVPNHGAWKGAILMAALVSIYEALEMWTVLAGGNPDFGLLTKLHNAIPFSNLGLAWLLPAVAGFIVGTLIVKTRGGEPYPMLSADTEDQ